MKKKLKTKTKKVDSKIHYRIFEFDRESVRKIDDDTREVDVVFSSEATLVDRWFGSERLGHDASEIRLDRMKNGAAVLVGHDLNDQVGVVETVRIEGADRTGRATLRFGKSARAEEIFVDIKDGIRRFVSVGYRAYRQVIESIEEDIETHRVVDWEPLEISIVSVPADVNAEILRSDEDANYKTEIEVRIMETKEEKEARLEKERKAREAEDGKNNSNNQVDTRQIEQAAIARVREIQEIGASFNMTELANQMIDSGRDVADMNKAVIAEMGKRGMKPVSNDGKDADIGLSELETRRFSILRALDALANPGDRKAQEAAAFEMDCSNAVAEVRGISSRGFFVPERGGSGFVDPNSKQLETRGVSLPGEVMRRDLSAGTATDGQELVSTDLLTGSFIDVLRNLSTVIQMGARTLDGLVGDVAIPRKTSGAAAAWIATEGGNAGQSDPQFDQVTLTPKTAGVYTEVTRQLLKQSSLSVENLVRTDFAAGMALLIDLAVLYGSGASGQPQGIATATGVNTPTAFVGAVPTFLEVIAVESAVANVNALMGTLHYLTETAMRGSLKGTLKAANSGMFVWEKGNEMNGYDSFVSNQVTSGDMFFGNWADALIGAWGGLDILIDPYTNSLSGTVRIVAHQSIDVALRHGESFAFNNDT